MGQPPSYTTSGDTIRANAGYVMVAESEQGSSAQAIFGCLLLLGLPLLFLSQCVFTSEEEEPKAEVVAESSPVPVARPTEAVEVNVSATPTVPRVGSTMLEQAIFDAFPLTPPTTKAERRKASNAADFVGATINSAGHLCAELVEAQQAAPGQYGVGCVKYRGGGGRANYLIDSRTGSVDEI